jgi:very-short-patch-repair endonuclease
VKAKSLNKQRFLDIVQMLNPKKTKKQRQYLRNHMTKWEVRLWNDLKGRKMFGFKVRRQYGIGNYILDFYCPQLKLAIEIDGDVHYLKEKVKKDRMKDEFLKSEKIKVIRIENLDFEEDYESVILYLEDVFKDRASERKIEINEEY